MNDKLIEALEEIEMDARVMRPYVWQVARLGKIAREALAASKSEPQAQAGEPEATTNEHTERAELVKQLHSFERDYVTTEYHSALILEAAAMLEAQRPALKPLTDEKLQGLYRYRLRANGVSSDPWYWYTSGSADTEAAHGIKEQA